MCICGLAHGVDLPSCREFGCGVAASIGFDLSRGHRACAHCLMFAGRTIVEWMLATCRIQFEVVHLFKASTTSLWPTSESLGIRGGPAAVYVRLAVRDDLVIVVGLGELVPPGASDRRVFPTWCIPLAFMPARSLPVNPEMVCNWNQTSGGGDAFCRSCRCTSCVKVRVAVPYDLVSMRLLLYGDWSCRPFMATLILQGAVPLRCRAWGGA